jgi:hypothetical protein
MKVVVKVATSALGNLPIAPSSVRTGIDPSPIRSYIAFHLTPTSPPSSTILSLFSESSGVRITSTMASSYSSTPDGLSLLDQLIRQRRDVTAARDKEDHERVEIQKSSDKLFEQSQTFKVARFEAAEALHLARERANQEAVLVQLKARHERELARLRRRQSKEIAFHDGETEKMLKEIQESTDVLVGELLWDLDAEARARSLERQREEEVLQTKRVKEDNILKDALLKTVDQENHRSTRPIPDPNTGHQGFIDKRVRPKESPNIPEADQRVLRSFKRQKLDHVPKIALPEAPTSPSATLLSEETKDLARVLSTLPEFLGNELPGKAIQTRFELKYIGGCLDYYNDTNTTWSAVPGQPNRTIRENPNKKSLNPMMMSFASPPNNQCGSSTL